MTVTIQAGEFDPLYSPHDRVQYTRMLLSTPLTLKLSVTASLGLHAPSKLWFCLGITSHAVCVPSALLLSLSELSMTK